jgi:hypothetical protein
MNAMQGRPTGGLTADPYGNRIRELKQPAPANYGQAGAIGGDYFAQNVQNAWKAYYDALDSDSGDSMASAKAANALQTAQRRYSNWLYENDQEWSSPGMDEFFGQAGQRGSEQAKAGHWQTPTWSAAADRMLYNYKNMASTHNRRLAAKRKRTGPAKGSS